MKMMKSLLLKQVQNSFGIKRRTSSPKSVIFLQNQSLTRRRTQEIKKRVPVKQLLQTTKELTLNTIKYRNQMKKKILSQY
jgi:hypothetical protein